MRTCIALFRGINVGGKNILPMKRLVVLFEKLGFKNITTYIQSGNVVFTSGEKDLSGISAKVSAKVKKTCGFEPVVKILEYKELEDAISKNPFPEKEFKPETMHLGFLAGVPPDPDLEKLEALRKKSERFHLIGKVFYLNAPEGIGRSKLAAKAERLLGVPMTVRNWRTACKVRDIAKEITGRL